MAFSSFIESGYDLACELWMYCQSGFMQYITRPSEVSNLQNQLWDCKSFHQWQDVALKLDHVQGNDIWRSNPKCNDYDFKLISSMVLRLEQLRQQWRNDELIEVIRSGLIRNIGSIGNSELYTRAYSGTKVLIENYVHGVVRSLRHLSSTVKLDERNYLKTFFKDARQSYGRTALVLHGGSLFGLCHLGVVKSLLYADLLPPVICGATVGSIVAAYVCSVPKDDIEEAIDRVSSAMSPTTWHGSPNLGSPTTRCSENMFVPTDIKEESDFAHSEHIDEHIEDEGIVQSRMGSLSNSLARTMFTKEVILFYEFVYDNLGDMTFEEAFAVSGRVLNILVLPVGSEAGMFYNYLTTPKVVVRSAILASIGSNTMPGHFKVDLYIKDYEGNVCRHPHTPQVFPPSNHKTYVPPRESPYVRLSELFNVNNHVVSISRPYLAPLLLNGFKYRGQPKLWQRLISLVRLSAQYRIGQLAEWGVISPWLKSIFIDEMIPGGFQVNVVPESDAFFRDFLLAFDSMNIWQKVKHWIDLGERSVWPQMSIIWARTKIEYTLDELYHELLKPH